MIEEGSEEHDRLCREILAGNKEIIVWGGNSESTMCEWQRQIKPLFMVDSQWTWWRTVRFHDLEIKSPIEIEGLDPLKTAVINNYYFSRLSSDNIDIFLGHLGGFPVMPPAHLHCIAQSSARLNGIELMDRAQDEGYVQYIDDVLDEMLTLPQDLVCRKTLPAHAQLETFFASYSPETYLAASLKKMRISAMQSYKPKKGRIALVIGSIDYGGAERQICNLAVGLKREGWEPFIFYLFETTGGERYRDMLREHGISFERVHQTEMLTPDCNLPDLAQLSIMQLRVLWYLRGQSAQVVVSMYKKIMERAPEIVISYLDGTNIYAGFASAIAGVRHVMLSGRSINPTNFAHMFGKPTVDSYHKAYPQLLLLKGLTFANNSIEGASSYASWLGIDKDLIKVIPNCVAEEFIKVPSPTFVKYRRAQMCLRATQPIILGVFRFTKEKRAHDFVRIIAAVHKKYPKLRAMICGQGPDKESVQSLIKQLKLQNVLHLLGPVEDVDMMMRCATLLLHTADIEGSPNVILEAQASGLPIVCAANGGTRQYLAKEWNPYMSEPGKIKEMAQSCISLLSQTAKRKRMALAVRRRALRETTSKVLAHNTLKAMGIEPVRATSKCKS